MFLLQVEISRLVPLFLLLLPAGAQFTTSSLRRAVTSYCNNPVTAEATHGFISDWDTSLVTSMSRLFKQTGGSGGGYCSSSATFNGNISCWDVSSVTDMTDAFLGCTAFNRPIINWDVSQVTSMAGAFLLASSFDQPLSWNVGNVVNMEGMFEGASSFSHEHISGWDVSRVITMGSMFWSASAFSESLCWDTSGKDVSYMFTGSGPGSVNLTQPKCTLCTAVGHYYDASCLPCPANTISIGKTTSCSPCPTGMLATPAQDSCYFISDPTATPTSVPVLLPTPEPTLMPTPGPTPESTQMPVPAPTPEPRGRAGACFHADGLVSLESGQRIPLAKVAVGDRILSSDEYGNFTFSPVVHLPHKENSELVTFLELCTEKGKVLTLTPDHLLPRCSGEIVPARELFEGDCVRTVHGPESVQRVKSVEKAGVYTAVTENKFIVVDHVVASSFAQDRDTEREFQRETRRVERQRGRKHLRRQN